MRSSAKPPDSKHPLGHGKERYFWSLLGLAALGIFLHQMTLSASVVDVLSMMIGVRRELLCARVDFVDSVGPDELEGTCMRIDQTLRAEYPELAEIFVPPVPKSDPGIRSRVVGRYGRSLADE